VSHDRGVVCNHARPGSGSGTARQGNRDERIKRKLQKEGKLGKQLFSPSRANPPANPFVLLAAAWKRNFAASQAFSTIASISAMGVKNHTLGAQRRISAFPEILRFAQDDRMRQFWNY
jgi:hypothetical protein